MRCANLSAVLLPILLAGCGKSEIVEILQTTNISSKVAVICTNPRTIYVTDVSEDGSVVVGKCTKEQAPDDWQAFRYSPSGGVENIGAIGGIRSIDHIQLSADGLVIWGAFYINNEGSHIFRYTRSAGFQDLGTMGKKGISVNAVSADGSAIVGAFYNSPTENPLLYHAFRYSKSQGFEDLGAMSTESTLARGVSADGSLIVGDVEIGTSSKSSVRSISAHAFRYSRSEGMKDIGVAGWGESAFATGVSNDGSVIVGEADFNIGFIVSFYSDSHVFIYTEKDGMQKLNGIGGEGPRVARISGDGTRIVGSYRKPNGEANEAYAYTGKIILPQFAR